MILDENRKRGSMCFNLMGLHFDPMPVSSSIEGKQKGPLQQSDNNNCTICNYQLNNGVMKIKGIKDVVILILS